MPRGALRIYLGAAPGVGKTYAMLGEGQRRKERGADVVVGVVETHGREHTMAQLGDLEVVPRIAVEYRGTVLHEMDVEAILRRRPGVVLVDEYAHTNAPGSRNEKRWQDVELLLDAGIDVVSTVNVQHLESLNDVITEITGTAQRETVPDAVVRRADQIELVDMTPEALRRRMAHGNIYPAERVDAALNNYFRPGNLGCLRELALLWVADRVEESLSTYLAAHGITETWETRERIVVGITGRRGGEMLIRRAARMAGRVGGDLIGVHVFSDDGLSTDGDGTAVGATAAGRTAWRSGARRRSPLARRGPGVVRPRREGHAAGVGRQPPQPLARTAARLVRRSGDPCRRRPRRARDRRPGAGRRAAAAAPLAPCIGGNGSLPGSSRRLGCRC